MTRDPWWRGHTVYLAARLVLSVDTTDPDRCWTWQRALHPLGYGRLHLEVPGSRRGLVVYAHRVAWEVWRDPIPPGRELDHRCGNRACINPDHLEVVTHQENTSRRGPGERPMRGRDGTGPSTWAGGTCKRGHDVTDPANVYTAPNGRRMCRPCQREYMRDYQQRARAEQAAR